MKLFSYTLDNENYAIGVETDDINVDLSAALEIYQSAQGSKNPVMIPFLQMLIEMRYCSGELIKSVLSEPWVKSKKKEIEVPENFIIKPPVARPSKIICIGRNYKAHVKELDHKVPDKPLFFAKAPSAIIGHNENIVIPSWLDTRVDHEAELGVIIGKQIKNLNEDEVQDAIAGYTIVNDITARDMQKHDIKNGNPWFQSKSLDTFMPVGPYIIPADMLENPENLDITLKVNGEVRQQGNTKDMIFNIKQIVSHISGFMTLEPGDIIATGTPEGVSPIKPGDTVEITISGLGTLVNNVVKE